MIEYRSLKQLKFVHLIKLFFLRYILSELEYIAKVEYGFLYKSFKNSKISKKSLFYIKNGQILYFTSGL